MLERILKKIYVGTLAAGIFAFGSAACESSAGTQNRGDTHLDVQVDIPDVDASPADYSFRSVDYEASQDKDSLNDDGVSSKCPTDLPCAPYKSPLEDYDPMLGDDCAPISIVWFGDYQDKYNRNFWEHILPLLKQDYILPGKAKLVFRDFPLEVMAQVAAEAAECAGEQGKYWEMHDKIFSEQAEQGDGFINFEFIYLKIWAAEIGLDMNKFKYCFDSRLYEEEVLNDYKDGEKAGAWGTPNFFINDKLVEGFSPEYSYYTDVIEGKLNEQCE